MFGLMLLQRVKEDILSGKVVVLVLVTVVLMCASTALTVGDLQRRQRIYEAAAERDKDLAPLLRRPELLSVLIHGVDADVYNGKAVAGTKVERVPPASYENPLLALFPTPDAAFIVQYILSLLALMMAFDIAAGPKERRTLSLIFSNPVSRSEFFVAQCAGGFLSVAVAFLLGYFGSVGILIVAGIGNLTAGTLARIAAIAVVMLLYLAVFFMVGAMISASTTSSARAIVASLLTWTVLVLVLSQSLMLAAAHFRRIASIEVVTAEMNAARNEILGKPKAFMTEWPKANQATEGIEARYAREVAGQERLMKAAMRVSPTGSYLLATAALAATSSDDAERYMDGVRAYLSRLRRYVYTEREQNPNAARPLFFERTDSVAAVINRAAPDAALLLLWVVAFGLFAARRFLRYDLR